MEMILCRRVLARIYTPGNMVIDLRNRLNDSPTKLANSIYAHRHSQSSEYKDTHAYGAYTFDRAGFFAIAVATTK